jgi:hypothetical protein
VVVPRPKRPIPRTTTTIRTSDRAPRRASRYALFGALALVAVAVAVAIAAVLGQRGGSPAATTTQDAVASIGPVVLSASELTARAAALDQPVYWLGPSPGDRYELTRTATNDVYVRYLPPGVKAGTQRASYVEVGTYPYKGALAAVKAAAKGHLLTVAGRKGGIAEADRGRRSSVYVAFPHLDYEIEVYAPRAKGARELATSGALRLVP